MVDISNKLKKVIELIANEEYFIINRPRQYGKTTTLFMLEKALEKNDEYLVILTSFEEIGDLIFEEESRFSKEFLATLADVLYKNNTELSEFLQEEKKEVFPLKDLSRSITTSLKKLIRK